ncbi:hypothetical protein KPL39_14995 [Clostridium gasigenes]|uniref:hypothetical protein n=1 Tax=Clostridium gasigenes TaxID=94869 RepID=UPI001C0BE562|nr:hypothetical protein [Clostridium gasigenes]MBU3137570.1 hypothetical protein [Clostridium gasigenes]
MVHYDNEVLKELTLNKSYTERELRIFIVSNKNICIISDSSTFNDYGNRLFTVTDISNSYIHNSKDGSFLINPPKQVIYTVALKLR